MAIVDLTTSAYPGNFGAGFRPTPGQIGYISRVLDTSAINLGATNTPYKLLTISAPLGGWLRTTIVAHTGEGATCTLDVGTTASATTGGTEIQSNFNAETTGTLTAGTSVALAAGTTTIYIDPDHAMDTAVVGFYFEVFLREE